MQRETLKKLYFGLLNLLGEEARLLKRVRRENHVVVLNLHQISPHDNRFWPPLHPELFDDLLVFLKRHFTVAAFREISEVQTGRPVAVLSFDDGYYNFIEYAMPVLDKHGLKANMNIIPSCAESGEPIWNVKLYDFLHFAQSSLIGELRLPGFDYRLKGGSNQDKLEYGLKISRFLKNRPRKERAELWEEVEKLIRKSDFRSTRMMTAGEIVGVAGAHEIGVHSFSHDSMEFEDISFFENDLRKCIDYFDRKLQMPVEIYAFPNGSFLPEHNEILRKSGVKYQLLVGEKYARRDTDVFNRFTIYGSSRRETRLQALGYNSGSY